MNLLVLLLLMNYVVLNEVLGLLKPTSCLILAHASFRADKMAEFIFDQISLKFGVNIRLILFRNLIKFLYKALTDGRFSQILNPILCVFEIRKCSFGTFTRQHFGTEKALLFLLQHSLNLPILFINSFLTRESQNFLLLFTVLAT